MTTDQSYGMGSQAVIGLLKYKYLLKIIIKRIKISIALKIIESNLRPPLREGMVELFLFLVIKC